MANKNILLFGAKGQVAWELQLSLSSLGDVNVLGSQDCDLLKASDIESVIANLKPDLLVNATAYTAVDKAESDKEACWRLNAEAPGAMAQACAKLKIPFIHYSTDYVFDGTATKAYVETDAVNPTSEYGRSKLAGEKAIAQSGAAHLIFRTSWVYGNRGHNFLKTIRKFIKEREELRVVDDQRGSPTWSRMIAHGTALVISQARGQWYDFVKAHSGVYHMTAGGETTWFQFANAILEAHKHDEGVVCKNIVPITTEQYPTPAKRPAFSVLSNAKYANTFNVRLPNWKEQLALALRESQSG